MSELIQKHGGQRIRLEYLNPYDTCKEQIIQAHDRERSFWSNYEMKIRKDRIMGVINTGWGDYSAYRVFTGQINRLCRGQRSYRFGRINRGE